MSGSYDDDYRNHRIGLLPRFNPVIDIVEAWAAQQADAIALVSLDSQGELDRSHTVAELAEESRRMARVLLGFGVKKGDRVLVMMPRVPEWYAVLLGVIRIGAVAIPTPNISTARDIAYRVRVAQPVAIVADGAAATKVDEVRAELKSTRVAFTALSGTSIEWYDFFLYGTAAAVVFPTVFFAAGLPMCRIDSSSSAETMASRSCSRYSYLSS